VFNKLAEIWANAFDSQRGRAQDKPNRTQDEGAHQAIGLQHEIHLLRRYQSMSKRAIGKLVCAIAVAALASLAAQTANAQVAGGVEGKVVKVDAAKNTITIAGKSGEQTYNVGANTVIVGPRGGTVRRRLHDPRFHAGLPITVVANATSATQLVLGVDHKAKPADSGAAATSKTGTSQSSGFRGEGSKAKDEEGADEDTEFPGKVKSADADKNTLTVTLLTGKDHTFSVGDAKITIGRRVSQKGLNDPAVKAGATVTVVTEEGGNKVTEVKLGNAGPRRGGMRVRSRASFNQ
jgi:hypothetical protein